MDTVTIVLLALGVTIIVLVAKGKPLYQLLVKLWDSWAFGYLLFGGGTLLILGLAWFWGLNMSFVAGAGIIVGLMFAVLFTDPHRNKG